MPFRNLLPQAISSACQDLPRPITSAPGTQRFSNASVLIWSPGNGGQRRRGGGGCAAFHQPGLYYACGIARSHAISNAAEMPRTTRGSELKAYWRGLVLSPRWKFQRMSRWSKTQQSAPGSIRSAVSVRGSQRMSSPATGAGHLFQGRTIPPDGGRGGPVTHREVMIFFQGGQVVLPVPGGWSPGDAGRSRSGLLAIACCSGST